VEQGRPRKEIRADCRLCAAVAGCRLPLGARGAAASPGCAVIGRARREGWRRLRGSLASRGELEWGSEGDSGMAMFALQRWQGGCGEREGRILLDQREQILAEVFAGGGVVQDARTGGSWEVARML
jgi:hypothetical protein